MHLLALCLLVIHLALCKGEWTNPNLKYYGFWTYNDTDYTNFAGDANLIYLNDLSHAPDAYSKGFNIFYFVEWIFYEGSPLTLRSDYQTQWKQAAAIAAPLLQNGTLLGFMMGDELVWNGLPWDDLNLSISVVKSTFPDAIVYYNEAYTIFNPGMYYPEVPPMLDWISIDLYPDAWTFESAQSLYTTNLYPLLQSHQQVMYVPPAYATSLNNVQYCGNPVCENAMIQWNSQALTWALNDPKFVGLFPWHWDTFPESQVPGFEYGINSLPNLAQLMFNIGREIINQNLTYENIVSGGICGLDTDGNADTTCDGASPLSGCPTGFEQQTWEIGAVGSGTMGFCGIQGVAYSLPVGAICGMSLMMGQVVTCGGYDPYLQGCPPGYTQNVWTAASWGGGQFYYCAKSEQGPDVVGTICGMVTNGGQTGIFCNGINPIQGCPYGYAPAAWDIPFGDGLWSVCYKTL